MKLTLKKWVKNIQTAAYNGAYSMLWGTQLKHQHDKIWLLCFACHMRFLIITQEGKF